MKKSKPKRPRVPEGKKLLQIPLDQRLHQEFKMACLIRNQTMIEFVEKAVRDEVAKTGSAGRFAVGSVIRRATLNAFDEKPKPTKRRE